MIPDKILNVFNRSIKMVCSNIACYCNDPVSDFTRKRKLPAETLIHFIVQMQSKSLNSELCEYFTDLDSLPTASALCQQRDKLDISAFQRIMHLFMNAFDDYKTWKGYHVLACDGSDVNIAYDEKDEDTKRQNGDYKPFSQFHINGLYDCINHVFWDTSIDTATKTRECAALMEMIMKHDYPANSIITADRGYEKYNLMACCIENNQKFLIRTKDINVYSSILSNLNLPDEEFDLNELKKMYHIRWDIETAFKVLKYIVGMTAFHSKKRNFIQQEIYAAILLHCLTNIITERIGRKDKKIWPQ